MFNGNCKAYQTNLPRCSFPVYNSACELNAAFLSNGEGANIAPPLVYSP